MDFKNLILCFAGVAIFSAVLDLFIEDDSKAFGFKAICGLAMTASIIQALGNLLNL